MLQFLLFVCDVIRVILALGILLVFLAILALIVLWVVKQIIDRVRTIKGRRAHRRMKNRIEEAMRLGDLKAYSIFDAENTVRLYEGRMRKDQETLDKATEYHHGITD